MWTRVEGSAGPFNWGGEGLVLGPIVVVQVVNHRLHEVRGGGVTAQVPRPHLKSQHREGEKREKRDCEPSEMIVRRERTGQDRRGEELPSRHPNPAIAPAGTQLPRVPSPARPSLTCRAAGAQELCKGLGAGSGGWLVRRDTRVPRERRAARCHQHTQRLTHGTPAQHSLFRL